ncbi:zinc-dependent alcohol dehydrogenase family protein [Streptomyces sp. H27-S2]|uniref:zinc-dependent alcohol dehydrogenase family protein n=1 Tax=Streptomyces antarcticus TaxID=2996458 RepID=UPI00226F996E|nr:NAD(P)-dependent alcohol dehydrogenase [Streptomyces sp. H27-S2]MCY0953031.1 NAD(P)-dependent alcohol dehydrogenase [Streptomyces sp. H27-S2]
MRRYRLDGFGGPASLRLEKCDVPVPGPRQVLVRMRAWSLNHRDLLIAHGRYGPDVLPGVVPVSDGAGEVVETGGEVGRWQPGDRVTGLFLPDWQSGRPRLTRALGGSADGVLAEYVVFDENAVVAAPAHLGFAEAATLPCAAVTAWQAVVEMGGLHPGQSVLTLGSGGVSVFALQIAAAGGARVIATSGSDGKLERLRALGAGEVINHAEVPDWGARVASLTGGGVDHVVEVGGAGTMRQSITAARVGGRISVIGVLSGGAGISPVPMLRKVLCVQGVQVGSAEMSEAMNRALEGHRIRPVIDREFPFSDAGDAYRYLESGRHVGKVVLTAD